MGTFCFVLNFSLKKRANFFPTKNNDAHCLQLKKKKLTLYEAQIIEGLLLFYPFYEGPLLFWGVIQVTCEFCYIKKDLTRFGFSERGNVSKSIQLGATLTGEGGEVLPQMRKKPLLH